MRPRDKAPVFVCGFPRSGTTLLYHMLLSAGGFAHYRAETWVFDMLIPRFGDLADASNRQELLDAWLQSRFFARSGLNGYSIRASVMANCRNGGDFLEIVMGSIARNQGVDRWADCTPTHLLYLPEIKRTIPDALVIHIIRDGRDAALSYEKQGWAHPLPWDRGEALLVASLYWEWMLRRGRSVGAILGRDYLEVRYEELVRDPKTVLAQVGAFIEHDLDYARIRREGVGSVSNPNTSFAAITPDEPFSPVGRWRSGIAPDTLSAVETVIGAFLEDLGYELANPLAPHLSNATSLRLRASYLSYFSLRHWAKSKTPLGRFLTNTDFLMPRPELAALD